MATLENCAVSPFFQVPTSPGWILRLQVDVLIFQILNEFFFSKDSYLSTSGFFRECVQMKNSFWPRSKLGISGLGGKHDNGDAPTMSLDHEPREDAPIARFTSENEH